MKLDVEVKITKPRLGDVSQVGVGWRLIMAGGRFFLEHERFGTLEWGMHPSGQWDQWLFHENNGGGLLVIPYTVMDKEVHVVLLRANRFNLVGDGDDYEAIGGFHDGNEIAYGGAVKEAMEEAGLVPDPIVVKGRHFSSNRAFFALDTEQEGCKVFAFEMNDLQASRVSDDPNLSLMPWYQAVRVSRDALTIAAIGRLFADLSQPVT